MFQFFKINEPFRILALFILLGILRIPIFIDLPPISIEELRWMLLGEKIANGFLLYRDIYDSTGPLSALFYGIIDFCFGKSHYAYLWLGFFLFYIQVLYFNYISNANEVFTNKSYVGGLIYTCFASLSFDFFTPSPELLGMTFILIALNLLWDNLKKQRRDEPVFNTGVFIAIASLFYLPLGFFLVVAIFASAIHAGNSLREIFIMILGFIFIHLLSYFYFFWMDSSYEYLYNYINAILLIEKIHYSPELYFNILILFSFGLSLIAYFLQANNSQSHFQWMCKISMLCYGFVSILIIYSSREQAPKLLLIVLPCLAFFGNHYLQTSKRWWFPELVIINLIIIVMSIGYFSERYTAIFPFFKNSNYMITGKPLVSNKNVLVLGDNLAYYASNKSATPYIQWSLAQQDFGHLNNYKAINRIYTNILKDAPEIIIDQSKIFPSLYNKIPHLNRMYEYNAKGFYKLRTRLEK